MSKAQTLPELEIKKNWSSEVEWDLWMAWFGVDDAISAQRILHFCKQLASTQKAEIRELVYSCLYEPQWVEVATPANFEAGKLNITKFDDLLDTLNEGKG